MFRKVSQKIYNYFHTPSISIPSSRSVSYISPSLPFLLSLSLTLTLTLSLSLSPPPSPNPFLSHRLPDIPPSSDSKANENLPFRRRGASRNLGSRRGTATSALAPGSPSRSLRGKGPTIVLPDIGQVSRKKII